MEFGTIRRALAWLCVGVAGLLVSGTFLLLAINWNDRPASPESLALSRLDRGPEVPDAANAYVYLMGLSVPQDADPLLWGAARARWVRSPDARAGSTTLPGPVVPANLPHPESVDDVAGACDQPSVDCAQSLAHGPAAVQAWLASEDWRLKRYDALLQRAHWHEALPHAATDPFPPYQHALEMQRLFLLKTWQIGASGDAAAVADRLERDARFWRRVLAHSDLLITKMIATAGLRRNLGYGALAIRALAPSQAGQGVPGAWKEPISADERSMLRALDGEWRWTQRLAQDLKAGVDATARDRALGVFFQPQDTANLQAAGIYAFQRARAVPYDQLATASRQPVDLPAIGPYNPVGRTLYRLVPASYADYAARVADLEGMRRAALAAAALHTHEVPPSAVSDALRALDIRDPYSGAPLRWNETARSIGFDALSRWPRGAQDYSIAY